MKKLSIEKLEELRVDLIKENKEQTLESQLGYFVGEYIFLKYLPTLSTEILQTRKVIQVSDEDNIETKRLHDEWWDSTKHGKKPNSSITNEKWVLYCQHNKMLEKKYLPENLICHIKSLNVENMEEFKKGLINSLWNSDVCSYSLKPENIKIYDDYDGFFTTIEFIRSVDV